MTKRQKTAIDREIERVFRAHCGGIQISVLDIPKVFRAGHDAAAAGTDIDAAVIASVAALRQN
jgi:hypothetical protein